MAMASALKERLHLSSMPGQPPRACAQLQSQAHQVPDNYLSHTIWAENFGSINVWVGRIGSTDSIAGGYNGGTWEVWEQQGYGRYWDTLPLNTPFSSPFQWCEISNYFHHFYLAIQVIFGSGFQFKQSPTISSKHPICWSSGANRIKQKYNINRNIDRSKIELDNNVVVHQHTKEVQGIQV